MTGTIRIAAVLVAALLVAACGGGGGAGGDGASEGATGGSQPADEALQSEADGQDPGSEAADGDLTPGAESEGTGSEGSEAAAAGGEAIAVSAVDYEFVGLPEEAPAGTSWTFTNEGTEPHEMVVFRLPEDETRSVEELLQLPEEEVGPIVGAPVAVAIALPGEEGRVVQGEPTFAEPGRYAVLCFIPTGTDPEAYAEAFANPEGGPPPTTGDEGPPHALQGMVAEITVA